jgi:hypothetical protein
VVRSVTGVDVAKREAPDNDETPDDSTLGFDEAPLPPVLLPLGSSQRYALTMRTKEAPVAPSLSSLAEKARVRDPHRHHRTSPRSAR